MSSTNLRRYIATVTMLAALTLAWPPAAAANHASASWRVKSATDVGGKVQILLRDGRNFTLPQTQDQCDVEEIQISPDGMTVGWIEIGYLEPAAAAPCNQEYQSFAEGPVIWRHGKIIRRFNENEADIDWAFYGNGDQIAYHAGPAHFDNDQAVGLYDITTGRQLKHWSRADKTDPPNWAKDCVAY